jgi:hypothetical protein
MSKAKEIPDGAGEVVVQSFTPHRHRFILPEGEIVLPASFDKKDVSQKSFDLYKTIGNILIVQKKEFDALSKNLIFAHLIAGSKNRKPIIRVLQKVPDGYLSADFHAAIAREESERLKGDLEKANKLVLAGEKEVAALKKKLEDMGGIV